MSNPISPEEKKLWHRWIEHNDKNAANELVAQYEYLINYQVQRVSQHLPQSVSREEIRSLAYFGLYDALKKFELSRNLKFVTYASFRIKGSIIDGLRKEDWLPRTVRDKAKKIEKTAEQLEQNFGRQPAPEEIAEVLNMRPEEVEETTRDVYFSNVLSVEEKPHDDGGDYKEGAGYLVPEDLENSPDEQAVKGENIRELTEEIKMLNEKERLVLSLFYEEELSLTEIGEVMNLTTSRISQIHGRAIFKLREALGKYRN
ncbi:MULTISPECIES: FliA/WhiG family RNA polymerase sigma factor [Salimicrobium]|uniref:RNA polymerase sigma factor SigD n=3 Tax=Salimicrobium TaxID=351195 RepID=K2FPH3_9BACI|nr:MULTISPECIES: FliA/WhiG family RNA polymerase sigma factor [Salimicrobium]AKG04557.1 RNA polymerase subunit sigma [Salimicrobium jeotgali]EKE32771.1 RNA polymerase sigma factor SigD [Salimicrobium jeotgali]MBM7695241.1 RNA polymerase sigma factor for flagellar operon FliA [Salimicrobium jeotgali]SDX30655.1 RNA polymerase sigma factor for flagellar operon FliA [Salimicrobium album]SIS63693.1 RNA polymerase, sigma 28 subunit, SigD/FliA/WhiG [Salimicrobium salexigens]